MPTCRRALALCALLVVVSCRRAPTATVSPKLGLLMTDNVVVVRPQCTDTGWYERNCDGNWNFAIAGNKAGETFQGCSAHTYGIYGADGATYFLIDQCHPEQHCTGSTGTYKRPADALAAGAWDELYITGKTLGDGTHLTPQQWREAVNGYYNDSFAIPTGTTTYTFLPLSQVQPPSRQTALAFANGCTGSTPTPTLTPTPASSPTPLANPHAQDIEALKRAGITAGCGGGNYCPDAPLTRAQAATWMVKASHAGPIALLPCQTPPAFADVRCVMSPATTPVHD